MKANLSIRSTILLAPCVPSLFISVPSLTSPFRKPPPARNP